MSHRFLSIQLKTIFKKNWDRHFFASWLEWKSIDVVNVIAANLNFSHFSPLLKVSFKILFLTSKRIGKNTQYTSYDCWRLRFSLFFIQKRSNIKWTLNHFGFDLYRVEFFVKGLNFFGNLDWFLVKIMFLGDFFGWN